MKKKVNSNKKVLSPLSAAGKSVSHIVPSNSCSSNKKLKKKMEPCIDSVSNIQTGLQTLRSILSEYTPKAEMLSVEVNTYRKEFNEKTAQLQSIENSIKDLTEDTKRMKEEKLVLENELLGMENENKEIKEKADKLFAMNTRIIKNNDGSKEMIKKQKDEVEKVKKSIEQTKNKEIIIAQHIEVNNEKLKSYQEAVKNIKVTHEQAKIRLQEAVDRHNKTKENIHNLDNQIINAQGKREDAIKILSREDWQLVELKMNKANTTARKLQEERNNIQNMADRAMKSIGDCKEVLNRNKCKHIELEAKKGELESQLLKKTIEVERNNHKLIKLEHKYQRLLNNDMKILKDISKLKESVKVSQEENYKVLVKSNCRLIRRWKSLY